MNFQESFIDLFGNAVLVMLGAAVAVTVVLAVVRVASIRITQRIRISRREDS